MTIEMARAGWRWARGWREWCFLGVVAVAAFAALAAGVHFSTVVVLVFFACLLAAKSRGDHRVAARVARRFFRGMLDFLLAGLAADLPGYVLTLAGVPAGMMCAAVERREEERVEGRLRPKGQPI